MMGDLLDVCIKNCLDKQIVSICCRILNSQNISVGDYLHSTLQIVIQLPSQLNSIDAMNTVCDVLK